MKKIYTSPKTTVVPFNGESLMAAGSVGVRSYLNPDGETKSQELQTKYNYSKDIQTWFGTEQPETSKDNGGSLWEYDY